MTADTAPVLITWNATNWITITLMAFLSFLAFSFIASFFVRGRRAANKEE